MKKTPKQKALDIEYICDLVSEKHRLKRKYMTKFDNQIDEILKAKKQYEKSKNKELNDLVASKCKELKVKENIIYKIINL